MSLLDFTKLPNLTGCMLFCSPRTRQNKKERGNEESSREYLSSTVTKGRIFYLRKGMADKIIKWRYIKS